jgi:hypothetical protein
MTPVKPVKTEPAAKVFQAAKKSTAVFLLPSPEIHKSGRIFTIVPVYTGRHTGCSRAGVRWLWFGVGNLGSVGPEQGAGPTPAARFFWRRTNAFVREEHNARTWPGLPARPDREWERRRRSVAAESGQGGRGAGQNFMATMSALPLLNLLIVTVRVAWFRLRSCSKRR